MPKKVAKNVFYKGMNLDADISMQPGGTYRDAYEYRLAVDTNGEVGALQNVKGNENLNLVLGSDDYIIGSVPIGNYLILFTTGGLDLTTTRLAAEEIGYKYEEHIDDTAYHTSADTNNILTESSGTTLSALIDYTNDIVDKYNTHNRDAEQSAGWSYHTAQIATDESVSTSTITTHAELNAKLNSLKQQFNDHDSDSTIHNDDSTWQVTFTDLPEGNISKIYKVTFVDEAATATLLWSDAGKSAENKMNLDTSYPIKGVSRIESDTLHKVYWVDNYNYLRYVNVAEYLTDDGLVKSGSNDYVSAKTFGTVGDITFVEPTLTGSGGGGLNVGMVQYAYQLYNKNGSESAFSPATGLYHLTSSSDNASDNSAYKGNIQGEESGKSLSFNITLSNYEYDSIRIVSIYYDYYSQLPEINIITEKAIPSNGIVAFTDTGSGYTGSYTVEQFSALAGLYKSKDIASSKNYLFLANVTENYFDIGDYDARAYRFKTTTGAPGSGSDTLYTKSVTNVGVVEKIEYNTDTSVLVTISGFSTRFSVPSGRTVTDVTDVTENVSGDSLIGTFTDGVDTYLIGAFSLTYSNITYTAGTDTLTFIATSATSIFAGVPGGSVTMPKEETTLQYIDFDYTYTTSGDTVVTSIPHEGDGFYWEIQTDGTWVKKNSSDVTVSTGANWSIPSTANVINYYNDPTNDGDSSMEYVYKTDGTTLGGSGKNISYDFTTEALTLDENFNNYSVKIDDSDSTLGFNNYCSPNKTANARGFQRDETYRFGIVFFDKYGRESVVSWIGDIRMPSMSTYSVAAFGTKVTSQAILPRFTISSFPTGAVSYKIVRLERDTENRSIVSTGILRPTLKTKTGGNNRQIFHAFPNDDMNLPDWFKYDLLEFISPEVSFYKNLQVLGNDYIQLHDISSTSTWDPANHDATPGDDWNIKARAVTASSSIENVEIAEGKLITPRLEDEVTAVAEFSYYGYFKGDDDGDEKNGINGTSLIFKPETATNHFGTISNSSYSDTYMRYAVYRRDIEGSQYGGNTYSVRANNEYIAASEVNPITTTTVTCGFGDTYTSYFEQMAISHSSSSSSVDDVFLNFMIPVDSTINCQLRYDDRFSTIYRLGSTDYQNLREVGVSDGTNEYTEMYLYNTVYSQENTLKKYFPLPEGETFEENKQFKTRIIVSEKKFNGEASDSWLTFLTNNFIDVDANHGDLNNIMDYNNNLLFWQDRAFGVTDVDPRSLITDNNATALVLGTGAVLSRFDYLSTTVGNQDLFGLARTPLGIYWYDPIRQMIIKYNGKEVNRLSKLKGTQSFLNEGKFDNCLTSYMPKYDEILFTLTNGDSSSTTLVFNELNDSFTGFYNMVPIRSVNINNYLLTSDDNFDVYMHDTASSSYGQYYGGSINESTVKVPINIEPDLVKVFDVLNFITYTYDGSNNLIFNDVFDEVRCYNSFQNTDYISLTAGTNVMRKKGIWTMHVPRNVLDVSPYTNPDIFDDSNFDLNRLYKERLRDIYMVVDFKYLNTNNYRFNIPSMYTKYRTNYR